MSAVTFLGHSGFLVELPQALLLFDWWKGDLPPLPAGKPLLVFASHRHEDHFSPAIFSLEDGSRPTAFLLGDDIRLSGQVPQAGPAGRYLFLAGGTQAEPFPGITVEALPSTDEGVAFLVTAADTTVFHAGDLNWWHWEGEDPAWNQAMAADFQRACQPLQGRRLDIAMLPLDPRLGKAGALGPRHFLETAEIRRFFPMHQWEDFSFTDDFLRDFPQFAGRTVPVRRNGQRWEL